MRIEIKPMSVNKSWQGRRFKTPEYKAYERELLLLLKPMTIPKGDLVVSYTFGVNTLCDWDNPIKPFQDILQKKYDFDDRRIMEATVKKVVVKKGNEFIEFSICSYLKEQSNAKNKSI